MPTLGALSSEATAQPLMLLGSENIVPSVLSWGKSPSRAAYTPKESKFTGTPVSIFRHTELFFPLCPQGSWFGTSSWSNSCCTRYHDPLTLGATIESGLLLKDFLPNSELPYEVPVIPSYKWASRGNHPRAHQTCLFIYRLLQTQFKIFLGTISALL